MLTSVFGWTHGFTIVCEYNIPSPRSAYEPGETLGDCGRNKVTLGGASPRVGVVSRGATRRWGFEVVKQQTSCSDSSLDRVLAIYREIWHSSSWFGEIATYYVDLLNPYDGRVEPTEIIFVNTFL